MKGWKFYLIFSFGVCVLFLPFAEAATLSVTFSPVSQGSDINLTADGSLDWVHWGLQTDSDLDRKAGVTPQISDFTVLYDTNLSFAAAYHYDDNFNGYSWSDGAPTVAATNTTTGVYVVKSFNPIETNGFEFFVPADTTEKTLKVYVGTFAARGKFEVRLNEIGVPAYSDTTLVNTSNGPGGVYIVSFAANSPGKILSIRWTVAFNPASPLDANVTLQSATLSSSGANNKPYITLTSPVKNTVFSAPANILIAANFGDADGTVTNVAFFNHDTFLGQSTNGSLSWNAPAGFHVLTARAMDNLGASSTSNPVEIFGNTSGGGLTGSVASSPVSVNLTAEGTRDWAHWGLVTSNSFDHKTNIAQQISNFTKLGANVPERFFDNYVSFSWTDGTPTANTNTKTGVFVYGVTNGFEVTAPADTTARDFKIYVSLYGAIGVFQAYLSDFSAPAFTDTSLSNVFENSYAVYTLNYAAGSANQSLNIRFKSKKLFDADFGNVALASATLSQTGPQPPTIFNIAKNGSSFAFSFLTETNVTYLIQFSDSLNPINWQILTNWSGNGDVATITETISGLEKFYRITAH